MKQLRAEHIDFSAVRIRGNEAEQHALAQRMFNTLSPLFAHLADKQYTHYLDGVVRDEAAVAFRGIFLVDENQCNQGLVAVRIEEMQTGGQTIAHLTIHLGLHPAARGERYSINLIFREVLKYRFRHPLRPFYIIDTPVSAASFRKMHKNNAKLFPTPTEPVPESLWPICEAVAKQKGWKPIPGYPKEARLIERPLTELSRIDARGSSDEFSLTERWFNETTGRTPGAGILSIVPITYSNIFFSFLKQSRNKLKKRR